MAEQLNQIWSTIITTIAPDIGGEPFLGWLIHSRLEYLSREIAVVRVPSTEAKVFFDSSVRVAEEVRKITGKNTPVTFVYEEGEPLIRELASELPPFRLHLSDTYTFENFIIGPSNQLAHAASIAVAESPKEAYNPFYVCSGVGLGKTHLLQAICHNLLKNRPGFNICYISCEQFLNEFMTAVQSRQLERFRAQYRSADVFIVDDIHFLSNREQSQEEFFHTFNALYNNGKQIILSSDSAPKEIKNLEERLASRFKWGLVAQIDKPTFETRMHIIRAKAQLRGVFLPDDVVSFLAAQIDSNIREMEGAVLKLSGYASLLGKSIDLDLARTALGGTSSTSVVSIDDILKAVAAEFRVSLSDMQSKNRSKSLVYPRQVAIYLCREMTRHSQQEIGGYFGGRDHTTVKHAENKIGELILTDENLQKRVAGIKNALRQEHKI